MIIAYPNSGEFFGEPGLFEQAGHEQQPSAWVRAKIECDESAARGKWSGECSRIWKSAIW
jgi:hypothetical protein